jgi:hypothetical protein
MTDMAVTSLTGAALQVPAEPKEMRIPAGV